MVDLDEVLDRLERIEADNAELRRLIANSELPAAPSNSDRAAAPVGIVGWSRRDVMKRAAIAATGAAAAVALLPVAGVQAADSLILGDSTNAAAAPTGLTVTQPASSGTYGLGVTDAGLNSLPESASLLGHARDTYDNAILGFHQKGGTGVKGLVTGGSGTGVEGRVTADGTGVFGVHDGTTNHGAGVVGVSRLGVGVWGSAGGVGVTGESRTGRGGVFKGAKAALQLEPRTAASSHPRKGRPGDLFVDKEHRLWFCKGGTTWTLLA